MQTLTKQIGQILVKKLVGFNFFDNKSQLIKITDNGWQAIVIEALPTASIGINKLAAHAQIRIEQIESIYAPFHPFLTRQSVKTHPTVVINCDILLRDNTFIHGFSADEMTVKSFAENYGNALYNNVVPWMDKYSQEDELYKGLVDADPKKWITSDRLIRFPVLLAILARRGAWNEFDRVACEFDKFCEQRHTVVYKPLADAMHRIQGTA